MGFSEEYEKLRKKELEAAEQETDSKAKTFSDAYNKLRPKQVTKKKQEEWSLEAVRQAARNIGRTGTIEPGSGTWFTGGAFEDGYDFGDLTRTVLGTASDAVDDLFTGAVGIVEPVIDTGAFLAGGVGSIFGADEFADDMRKFIKDDLIDEEAVGEGLGYINPAKWGNALLGGSVEENSVLGEKADALAQSGGQMAATIGLQAVHVPWWVTTSVTSFGSAAETAFKEGGGYGEATLRGVVSAGAEVLTEKLFGGSGLKEKGMFNLDGLTKGIADKAVKALADFGVDMAAEGVEEVVSEFINNLGSALYKEEDLGTILASEEALEGYLDAFIGGAILSGTMNVGKVTNSVKKGQDYRTGLTANEQKVFDSEYQKRLDEAGEISKKEKAKIYDEVMEDFGKGYFSPESIKNILGEDTSKAYEEAFANEESIRKEYEELGKKKTLDAAEKERYEQLKQQMKLLDNGFIKNSFAEQEKRKQRFEADLSQYKDENARKTVENAMKYGLHNGTDAHEFVDFAAKLAAKKGYVVDFTNTKMLKESGKEQYGINADAKDIEAFVSESQKKIVVNMDSGRSYRSLIGHEITHTLETASAYGKLQEYLAEYAKQKGDYDTRLADIEKRYKGVEADAQKELTADLAGDYLLEDYDFIKKLLADDRNIFQKVYDEIKYMLKLATTGSKEARALEKAKHYYEKALREATKEDKTAEGNKYSLSDSDSEKDVKPLEGGSVTSLARENEQAYGNRSTPVREFQLPGAEPITEDIAPAAEPVEETEESVASVEKEEPNVQADAKKTASETEDARLEYEKASLLEELRQKKAEAQAIANNKNAYFSNKAKELYEELRNLKKGVRASKDLGYLLDHGFEWSALKAALTNIRYSPEQKVNQNSVIEQIAREMLNDQYEDAVYRLDELDAEYEKKLAALEVKAGERRKQSAEASATGHVATVQERLEAKLSNAYEELSKVEKLRKASVDGYNAQIAEVQAEYDKKNNKNTKVANNLLVRIERLKRLRDDTDADYAKRVSDRQAKVEKLKAAVEKGYDEDVARETRAELQRAKVEEIETAFAQNGYDFQSVLKNAKDLSTFRTVDNTPQRVMEKALGYKEGQIFADETVNKAAQNESDGIKWLNYFTDRTNGLLAKISKQYHIKPGSNESAAAQMFAEGFYANDNGEYVKYGVEELEKDFPDANVRANIIGLAGDQRIRQIYDDTLKAINESRKRNGYPEIPRLENYFLHFRAMEDTFSKLGFPFNPNDIRAKDLPTDLNGVTADLKPGQPYFASAMHRRGIKTTHDLLGGLERYLSSAKNQIYHIDDIQTFRALRNFIANMYGQANGLDNLDELSEAEQKERIEEVFGSHLSTFAKFLHEEANILAGKTALIDRGLEGIIGRRGITFIDSLNKQVGANKVGFNASSAFTNLLSGIQAIAKTDKASVVKAFSQTAASKFGAIFGKENTFAENDPFLIRRKGAERFHRKWYQKFADAGYVLASAVDDITSEFIVRAKYNEYIKKGMNQQEALEKADKWSARLLGDRSLGQMPQIFNSKMLGLVTKFQLEVRIQLDSQFYDTIQEAKEDAKGVEEGLKRNAKIAANVTKTLFELAVLQHAFGKAFEAVAGYNPAFDIISVLATMFGFDDDDDSEDTVFDNVGQGFYELLEDMPYTSTFLGGGRIPVADAFPNVEELLLGVDENGNEKSRLETLAEVAPYYVFPGGYGQLKKTVKGLSMFDEDLPVPGSYTDSGNLRFPVEDTFVNRLQAGIFGQWANENAREYIENERKPLNEKQIQEYIDADMSIFEYWEYLDRLKDFSTLAEKADYIHSLDVSTGTKNLLINNVSGRKDKIDMSDYENYGSFEEFDFATKSPGKYSVSKAVGGYDPYSTYLNEMRSIKSDKDADGNTVSGSRKSNIIEYINSLDVDYGAKMILYKSEYPSDDTYNADILDYLNRRGDLSYDDIAAILKELGFTVYADGSVEW